MSFIIAYVTHPDRQTAEKIASSLLERRIIACANFFPITSAYWWKWNLDNSEEIVSLLKARMENWELLKTEIWKLHPYETPCIMKMGVEANEEYENWIQTETKQPNNPFPMSTKPQIIQDVGFDFSWDIEKVWKLDEPEVSVPIETLLWHFDVPFWEREWTDDYNLSVWETLANSNREVSHWQKIQDADLKYPLDVMPNKWRLLLLDWLHRLAKSYLLEKKEVVIRIIPRSRIPEILDQKQS